MKRVTYIQLAPYRLKEGVDEARLLAVSDEFQRRFVSQQPGIVRRVLVRAKGGGYADLVFFESREAAERVAAAEATSEHCLPLFQIAEPADPGRPDMGVFSFEHVRTYE